MPTILKTQRPAPDTTDFAIEGQLKAVQLVWGPQPRPILRMNVYRYANLSDALADTGGVLVGYSTTDEYYDSTNLTIGVTLYYRLAAVDLYENESAKCSHLFAVYTGVDTGDIINGAVTGTKIADAAITAGKFASSITPVELFAANPTTGNYTGRMVFNTTDKKLYRYNGTSFVSSLPSTDITGTLTDAQLAAIAATKITGQITGVQITDNAITAEKIAAGAVVAGSIAAGSIVAGDIATGAITSTKLAAGSVVAGKIAAGAIVAADIAANTLTAGQIAAGAISASELATGAVIAGKIAAGTIVAADIAAGTITANKLNITSLSAISATLGSVDISNAVIGTLTVGSINIEPNAVNVTHTDTTALAAPGSVAQVQNNQDLNDDGVTDIAIRVTWAAVTNAKSYEIEVSQSSTAGGTYVIVGKGGIAAGLSYAFQASTSLFYKARVRARNAFGHPGTWSALTAALQPAPKATVPPTPTGIVAADGILWSDISWTYPTNSDYAYTEVWSSTSNDFATATLAAAVRGNKFSQLKPEATTGAVNVYFWLYHVNNSGVKSVRAPNTTLSTYRSDANGVTDKHLASGAVITSKIGNLQVVEGHIATGAVTVNKIGDNAVTNAKIGLLAVGTAELATGAVTVTKLGDGQVTSTKLADSAVTNTKIADGAVDTLELASQAVTTMYRDNASGALTASTTSQVAQSRTATWGATCQYVDMEFNCAFGPNASGNSVTIEFTIGSTVLYTFRASKAADCYQTYKKRFTVAELGANSGVLYVRAYTNTGTVALYERQLLTSVFQR